MGTDTGCTGSGDVQIFNERLMSVKNIHTHLHTYLVPDTWYYTYAHLIDARLVFVCCGMSCGTWHLHSRRCFCNTLTVILLLLASTRIYPNTPTLFNVFFFCYFHISNHSKFLNLLVAFCFFLFSFYQGKHVSRKDTVQSGTHRTDTPSISTL